MKPKSQLTKWCGGAVTATFLLSTAVVLAQGYGQPSQQPDSTQPIGTPSSNTGSGMPGMAGEAGSTASDEIQRRVFSGALSNLNPSESIAAGNAQIVIEDDHVGIRLRGNGFFPNTPHAASIHKGTQCPTIADDTNGDGYIDAVEAAAVTDQVLVPLDGDLSSPSARSDYHPLADVNGSLDFISGGAYSSIQQGLGLNIPLDFNQTVIVVHGTDPNAILPSTVQGLPGLNANDSLPVACGTLFQISGPLPGASPSVTPSASPSAEPSASPSVEPSASPSVEPSASPSVEPSASPSVEPSASPSVEPSASPSVEPSASPSVEPSASPSVEPSASPSVEPSASPSVEPSASPSVEPSPSGAPGGTPSPSPSASPSPAAGMTQVTVRIPAGATGKGPSAYGTNPLTVPVGTTVNWVNEDSALHSATSDTPGFDTGVLQTGQNSSFTFTQPGTFPYHCSVHGQQSMSGTIVVQ
jgi:plastocyanin